MRRLAEAGHSVDVLSPFPDREAPPGYTDYDLASEIHLNVMDLNVFERRNFMYHYLEFFMLHSLGKDTCEHALNSQALARIMKRPPGYYDVIIMEQFNNDCLMGVAYLLQAPVIAMSSCAMMPWHYERIGAPVIPSIISAQFLALSQDMPFAGRLANWITVHSFNLMYKIFNTPAANALLRKRFGAGIPSTGDLVKNTSLIFVNQHYSLSGPKPLPPSVIEIGGIHIQPAKPLPDELQHLLERAEHGVVLISWGSLIRASSMPPTKLEGLLHAISRFKQQFIWKWENDTMPNKPDNVHIMKWIPQRDILAHPNVKAFMSHGGLMGTTEAVHYGVPVLGTPMYGDQFLNMAAIVQRGMAEVLDYMDISEDTVFAGLTKVLQHSYKENALAVSMSYNERSQKPLEKALWWVEYVAKTKGAPLVKSRSVHMSRFAYYSLDVYLVIGSVSVLSLAIIFGLIRLCCTVRQKDRTRKLKSKRH